MTSEPLPLSIELWPLSRFVEYAGNPRNNNAAVDRMCASVREFGWCAGTVNSWMATCG